MFPQDEFKKYAIEERQLNIATMDVFSRLMMDRIIFLGVPIDDDVANIIMAQLLFLETADPGRDIQLYFNSPGGSIYAGLGIYDTMQYINCDVATEKRIVYHHLRTFRSTLQKSRKRFRPGLLDDSSRS